MRPRISIRGFVRPSVGPTVCHSCAKNEHQLQFFLENTFVRDPRISYEGRRTTSRVAYETLMSVCLSPSFPMGFC